MSRQFGFTDDPEYMAGLNMGFSWKGFDVSMQWTAAWNVSRSISSVFRQPFTDRTNSDQGGLLEYMLDHTWIRVRHLSTIPITMRNQLCGRKMLSIFV